MSQLKNAITRCIESTCRTAYSIETHNFQCSVCGGLLDVEYDLTVDPGLRRTFRDRMTGPEQIDHSGVWRFRELLPFVSDHKLVVTLFEGNTPIYMGRRAAQFAGVEELRFKHLGQNPTGSFKDCGMTTGVTHAAMIGARAVACASTGNTSASMAAYAARAGMRALVLIPAGQVAIGKLAQALEYGAKVVEIEGNFDAALSLVREVTADSGVYLLNSLNPFRLEGQKTVMIELLEQMDWNAPDWIVLPGGNLGNASAFGKGLREMSDLGLINKTPRLAVIQAEHSAPFYDLFHSSSGGPLTPVASPATLATAIRIGNPVSWKKALTAINYTQGVVEKVSESEIADAKAILGRDGIGCEPASAATLAGIKRLVADKTIGRQETVVAILTGNLLKDPGYTLNYHLQRLELMRNGAVEAISSGFANRPVRAGAVSDEILKLLDLE